MNKIYAHNMEVLTTDVDYSNIPDISVTDYNIPNFLTYLHSQFPA